MDAVSDPGLLELAVTEVGVDSPARLHCGVTISCVPTSFLGHWAPVI